MSRLIKSNKIISRYEEQSILSAIERLSKQDKQLTLFFGVEEQEKRYFKAIENKVITWNKKLKDCMEYAVNFRITSKHYPLLKRVFAKYSIQVKFPKRQTKRQKINSKIINSDHNHYNGRM